MKNIYSRLMLIVLLTVLLFFFALTVKARPTNNSFDNLLLVQQQEVKGVVIDQNGLPFPGVTVAVKGQNRGTVTDIDGKYSIAVGPEDILVFSFLGFKTIEEPVSGRREINVELEEDISFLGEVNINAGYYNTTRRESTGNISRVTADEIELQPVISPLQALQGRMAGVEVIPGGDQPGMAPTIRIRGRNSIREDGNLPLYIIDGVPVNSMPVESNSILDATGIDPLNTLNLSNIQSIEVLKDADATAIYGSRGANGVVLITTKTGREGRTEVGVRFYSGVSKIPNRLDLLNTQEYLRVRKQAFENDGMEPTETNAYDLVLWDQNRNTNWQDFFFGGTSPVTDINLNVTGGNKITNFRLNGSFHNQGTVYTGDFDYTKVTGGAHLSHASENEKMKFDLAVNYGLDNNNSVGYIGLFTPAFRLPPNAPRIFNEDGSLHWDDWSAVGMDNPYAGFYNSSLTRVHNLNSSLVFSYELLKGLRIKSNFGYTNFKSDEVVKRPQRSYNPSSWQWFSNRSSHLFVKRNSWIIEPQLTYTSYFGKGNLDAIIGATFQQSEDSRLSLAGDGYISESLIGNLSAADNVTSNSNLNTEYRYNAIFARLGFNWDKKYYLNLTGRRDGSSRFGPNNRFANFGAIGGAWIFSQEKFLRDHLAFISFGKLRGSYGTTGNDKIGDYGYLDSYETTIGPGGLYPTQLANPDFSWEIVKKLEAAIELGFFKDRMNLGFSWYRNRSSNQLVGYSLPAITGFTSVQANLPATVENRGWEIEFSSYNFQSADFTWQSSVNLTIPRNELISYPGIEQSSYANTYRVGQPLNISFLYTYNGIDPETGFYRVVDINNDGQLDHQDKTFILDQGRPFFGGISNQLNYKNFSLQFLFQFVKQEGMLGLFSAGALENQRAAVIEALENNNEFQQISASIEAYQAYYDVLDSNLPIVDASFVRLKSLSLGFSIPDSLLRTLKIESANIFINGQNLLTITPYEGMDPETPGLGTQFAGLRTVTGGFQFNF